MQSDKQEQAPVPDNAFSRKVDRKARRRLRAQQEGEHSVWFGLGMFGLIGWSIAMPTVAGIALGVWLDRIWQGPISWTLTLLFVGLLLGCFNAWRWVKRESGGGKPL